MLPLYSISVCGGLEEIAAEELQSRLIETGKLQIVDRKPKRVLFHYSGDPRHLLKLRAAENVFLVIRALHNMTRSRHSLSAIRKSLGRIDFRPHFDICRRAGLRIRKRVTFRVTSRLSGQRNFRRIDAQHVVEQAFIAFGWQLAHQEPALDVWAEIHGSDAYISIRLSPIEMAQRDYKVAHIPASLKPTVAHCLVHLSDPQPDDVFLDPMCGAGTILIERAYSGRYRYLLGGDISTEALQAAQTNIGRKHRPRQLFHWDAASLPLAQWSVDKVVCNLPFGEKIEVSHRLYQRFLKEAERVLKPTGRMVLLTTQRISLDRQLKQQRTFRVAQRFEVDLFGLSPWVYLCLPH